MRLVFEYGSSPPISLDLCADDEDPSQLIIRPRWDAPHVRCFPRTFCAWPCLLRQVGTVLGSPYDYVVARLAYANPGSRHKGADLGNSRGVVAIFSRVNPRKGWESGGLYIGGLTGKFMQKPSGFVPRVRY